MLVLKNSLGQEIRNEIQHFLTVPDMWKYLDETYGNKRNLIDSIMSNIKRLRPCRTDDLKGTIDFVKTIERANGDAASLEVSFHLNNCVVVREIEEKMTSEMYDKWITKCTEDKEIESDDQFSELLEFLRGYRKKTEYRLAAVKTWPGQQPTTATSSAARRVSQTGLPATNK